MIGSVMKAALALVIVAGLRTWAVAGGADAMRAEPIEKLGEDRPVAQVEVS